MDTSIVDEISKQGERNKAIRIMSVYSRMTVVIFQTWKQIQIVFTTLKLSGDAQPTTKGGI